MVYYAFREAPTYPNVVHQLTAMPCYERWKTGL